MTMRVFASVAAVSGIVALVVSEGTPLSGQAARTPPPALVITAFGGNVARYINHACRPNCYVEIIGRHIWIRASRDIRKGEELTYDYNTDGVAGIPCRCRPGCRKII